MLFICNNSSSETFLGVKVELIEEYFNMEDIYLTLS